jgi:hypothetical protein
VVEVVEATTVMLGTLVELAALEEVVMDLVKVVKVVLEHQIQVEVEEDLDTDLVMVLVLEVDLVFVLLFSVLTVLQIEFPNNLTN